MTQSWEDYAKQKRKEFGMKEPETNIIPFPIVPKEKRKAKIKPKPLERRFNIHRRSTAGTIDKIVMWGLPSRTIAEQVIKRTTNEAGRPIFQTRLYQDKQTERDALSFYEPIPADATPKERSIYFNPNKLTVEPVRGFKPV